MWLALCPIPFPIPTVPLAEDQEKSRFGFRRRTSSAQEGGVKKRTGAKSRFPYRVDAIRLPLPDDSQKDHPVSIPPERFAASRRTR